jgi:apolipoprotein N-acyltransferase
VRVLAFQETMLQTVRQDSRRSRSRRLLNAMANEAALQEQSLLRTFAIGMAGALLLWAAFPPVNWAWLAWIAPVPWLWLAGEPRLGKLSYCALWLAGFVHWLLMLEGIRLAHPALYAGWIALAAYLGVYLPVFVGLCRVAVRRLGLSLMIAAPVIWVGLELLRGHLITGFSMGLLAHTQAEFPTLIQISDVAGGYTLSFLIMLVAACISTFVGAGPWFPARPTSTQARPTATRRFVSILIAALGIAFTLAYGRWRLSHMPPGASGPAASVALIQGSLDTVFERSAERDAQTYEHYRGLTARATGERPDLDLVIWPESMFVDGEVLIEEPLTLPPDSPVSDSDWRRRLTSAQADFAAILANEAAITNRNAASEAPGASLLVGTSSFVFRSERPRVYNTALLADRMGNVVGRYQKTHPVMFGEYIPFGAALPWLYSLTPMSGGLSIGDGPKVFEVGGLKMSPSICFESTVPHLIRGQLAELERQGTPADVLVSVTNDGWFWGTAMLDHHFRCGVFRAVENRKPFIAAANTGISCWVDGNGVIRARGPKRTPDVIFAEVRADGRSGAYSVVGDLPAWLCALFCLGIAVTGWFSRGKSAGGPPRQSLTPAIR